MKSEEVKMQQFKKYIKDFMEKYDMELCSSFIYRPLIIDSIKRGGGIYDAYTLKLFDKTFVYDDNVIEIKFKFDQKGEVFCKISAFSTCGELNKSELYNLESYEELFYMFTKILFSKYFKDNEKMLFLDEQKYPIEYFSDIIYTY